MSVASPPRSQELRDAVLVASEKLAELRSTHPDRRGDNWENETRAAASEVTDLDRQFTAAQHIEDYDLRAAAFAAAVANPGSASTGPTAAGDSATERALSAGQRVTDRDEYREFAERGGRFPEIELRTLVTSYSTDVNDSDVWLPVGTPYLKDPRQQRFFLRDVLDVARPPSRSSPTSVRSTRPPRNSEPPPSPRRRPSPRSRTRSCRTTRSSRRSPRGSR